MTTNSYSFSQQLHVEKAPPQMEPHHYALTPAADGSTGASVPAAIVVEPVKLKEFPARVRCQYCGLEMTTVVTYKVGNLTWLSAGAVCVLGAPFGLFLGCCLIPFCIRDLKDAKHTCASCGQIVGVFKRL